MRYPSIYYVFFLMTAFALQGCGGDGGSSSDNSIQLDLPFDYAIGNTSLDTNSAGGTVYVSVGAYGAHFLPFSGDPIGDAKSNMTGWFVQDKSELTELAGLGGNGNGVFDTGESCGFWGGMAGEEIYKSYTYLYLVNGRNSNSRDIKCWP